MGLNDTQATAAKMLGDGLRAAQADAREVALHDDTGDVAELAADLGSLVQQWGWLHESLLADDVTNESGDLVTAAEHLTNADTAIRKFRAQATDLSEITSGLNLPLVTTNDGQKAALGSLIQDLIGRMSTVIVELDAARQAMQPSATAVRLASIERTLLRVSQRAAAPVAPKRFTSPRDKEMAARLRQGLTRKTH